MAVPLLWSKVSIPFLSCSSVLEDGSVIGEMKHVLVHTLGVFLTGNQMLRSSGYGFVAVTLEGYGWLPNSLSCYYAKGDS